MTVKYMNQMVRKAMDDMDLEQRKGKVTVKFDSYDRTLRVSRFGTTVLVLDFELDMTYEVGVVMWRITSKSDADALNTVFETLASMNYDIPELKFSYRPKNGGGYAQFLDGTEFK